MIEVKVEDVGPCRKLLKIRVPKDDIKAKLDESYENLRKSATVDGFRKRHVPRRLLEKRFGEQVLEDLKQSLMADASAEAVEREKLDLLGEPSFDSAEFKPDEDFNFQVTVEVRPQFDIEGYKGLVLTRPQVTVTEEEVTQGIHNFLRRRATWELAPDGRVQEGDRIVCDWEVRVGDEVAASDKDDEVEVAAGAFAGVGVVNFVEQMRGCTSGEKRSLALRFPDDFANEKYRGKEGMLHITPKEIRRAVVPELTAELARQLDFDSVEQLREEVRRQMAAAKQRAAQEALEEQVREQLLTLTNFDLPAGLVKRQARDYMRRQQLHLRLRGVPEAEINKHLDELRSASEEAAARNFKIFFILEKIAEKEKVFVTENEVDNMIAALANRYGTTARKMRQELEQSDSLAALRTEMRQDKVMRLLLDAAQIRDAGQ